MTDSITLISFVAAILQLLKSAGQLWTHICHFSSASQAPEQWSRDTNLLLSLIQSLESKSPTFPDEVLLHSKEELAVIKMISDERVIDQGSGRLKEIMNTLSTLTSRSKVDRTLASAKEKVNLLASKAMLHEFQRHQLELRDLQLKFLQLQLILEESHHTDIYTNILPHSMKHIDIIDVLTRAGLELQEQGKLEDARAIHEMAFSESKKKYGDSHSQTFLTMNNLGLSLQALGKYNDAHTYLVRAFEGRKRCFGHDDPAALRSMCNVAVSFQLQNQLEEALSWQEKCCKSRRKVLGDDHPETLKSISNLAIIAYYQQNLTEAESLFTQAATQLEINLGLAHPDTLTVFLNLARCFNEQLRYAKAESVTLKILKAAGDKYGSTHSQTLAVQQTHSIVLHSQCRFMESLHFAKHIRDTKILQFGLEDPRTKFSIKHVQQLDEILQS